MEATPQKSIQEPVTSAQELSKIGHLAQLELAKAAFPKLDARSALKEWIGNPDDSNSLAAAFRNYIDDPTHIQEQINLHDPVAVAALLEAVRAYKKETLH